jgi:pimeloyl-ACP methyl ester carboxylesterase
MTTKTTTLSFLAIVAIMSAIMAILNGYSISIISFINAQPPSNDTQSSGQNPLPVLLIHGYAEDSQIWKKWDELLKKDGIAVYTMNFKESDDKCGSSAEHAKELNKRVKAILNSTGQKQVNLVGHSKGGLDARVFLADSNVKDVANLIMIGTPNNGSPAAEFSSICEPAIDDLKPGANSTKAKMNPNTKYYTISGDWTPITEGNPLIPGKDDGLVPVKSVESEKYFKSLGRTGHAHADLLSEDEYNMSKGTLAGKR